MAHETKAALVWEMLELAREVVAPNPATVWQVVVNGGMRQDIGQVHGHLIYPLEHAPGDAKFELTDPAIGLVPWMRLLEDLDAAARRPENGYSVVFDLTARGPVAAWIAESGPP